MLIDNLVLMFMLLCSECELLCDCVFFFIVNR